MRDLDLPPLHALFLVAFDQKVGYTVAWHREVQDVSLDGVEFKSLPSGLHGVLQDLVYFLHGPAHAGVSAFVQEESDEAHRNANFVAVGALVPLSEGRLGRGWMFAERLRELAKEVVGNVRDTEGLERFWHSRREQETKQHGEQPGQAQRQDSSVRELESRRREKRRSDSNTTHGLAGDEDMPVDHPVLSLPDVLDAFGPLLFPIYRAALLRKSILFLGHPPVQRNCNIVYILSALSSIDPRLLSDIGEIDSSPTGLDLARFQPLFNVGVSDIPFLSCTRSSTNRWLACTTDTILRDKSELWDLLVELPTPSSDGKTRHYPRLHTAAGTQVRATQRDLRRYHLLRSEIRRLRLERTQRSDTDKVDEAGAGTAFTRRQQGAEHDDDDDDDDDDHNEHDGNNSETESTALLRHTTAVHPHRGGVDSDGDDDPMLAEIVEPVTWTAMAYNGLMWWTSAGEMEAFEQAEMEADQSLLDELPEIDVSVPAHSGSDGDKDEKHRDRHKAQVVAAVVTVYFHRLTELCLRTMGQIVEDSEEGETVAPAENEDEGAAVTVSAEEMAKMGLDTWSPADKEFVQKAMKTIFRRSAVVEEEGVKVCGVRIC